MFSSKPHTRTFEARRRRFALPAAPTAVMLRVVLLAALGALAAAWALARHATQTLPPMLRPTPSAGAPSYDPDAGEIPAPDFGVDGDEGGAP